METLLEVLEVFFQNPGKERNAREVSQKSSLSYGTIYNYLNDLEKRKFLSSKKAGKSTMFKPNMSNLELLKYFEILEIRNTREFLQAHKKEKKMLDSILKNQEEIRLASLFGSFAREEHVKESDIDLLVVGNKKKLEEEINKKCKDFGITKGKEINPVFTQVNEFRRGIHKKDKFYKELWKDRVILKGEHLWWRTISKHGAPSET